MAVATLPDTEQPQHLWALERANKVRFGIADLKRDMRAGRLSFRQALADPRAQSMTVLALLIVQERWGRTRALRCLRTAGAAQQPMPVLIGETRRVGALTTRERLVLADSVEGVRRAG